jgi:archaellum component FlaC
MSSKEFDVNGTDYTIAITEQVIGHVNNLKNLYNAAYEDPESFEDVSAEISSTITEIASTVEPEVEDSDLDGLIQEVIHAVDSKAAQIEKELSGKGKPGKKSKLKK